MTKTEVAAALGVSEKTVTRYVASGRLPAQYVRGKTGQQLEIAPADVQSLQAELAAPAEVLAEAPVNEMLAGQTIETVAGEMPESERLTESSPPSGNATTTALARAETPAVASAEGAAHLSPPLTLSALARIVRAVIDEDASSESAEQAATSRERPSVPVESKLLLSLDEAVALSGVPRAQLDAARRAGQLSARRVGRGFKIRRADLETFVASLWD